MVNTTSLWTAQELIFRKRVLFCVKGCQDHLDPESYQRRIESLPRKQRSSEFQINLSGTARLADERDSTHRTVKMLRQRYEDEKNEVIDGESF